MLPNIFWRLEATGRSFHYYHHLWGMQRTITCPYLYKELKKLRRQKDALTNEIKMLITPGLLLFFWKIERLNTTVVIGYFLVTKLVALDRNGQLFLRFDYFCWQFDHFSPSCRTTIWANSDDFASNLSSNLASILD